MKMFKRILIGLFFGLMMINLGACENEGVGERVGEEVDEGVEETQEAVEEAQEEIER
ncbi:MAG: hypothetical protein R2940_09055 [Syntrophotaleaceae bacterium]